MLRTAFFRRTGCTKLCFFLGGIGASLTICATSLTYIFLHEQLGFSASLLANQRLSAACSAMQMLAFDLLQSSPDRADLNLVMPTWKLGAGYYTTDEFIWTSRPSVELSHNATRSARQQILHPGHIAELEAASIDRAESIHEVSHWVPGSICTEKGVQKIGGLSQLPLHLYPIIGEQNNILIATLPAKGRSSVQDMSEQFAVIDLEKMIRLFEVNENLPLSLGWLPDSRNALKIESMLSLHSSNNSFAEGFEAIASSTDLLNLRKEGMTMEEGLHQDILLNTHKLKVIYEAWADYSHLDSLPRRVAGLIFIVGLMTSGVGVMVSRSALLKEAEISDELLRQSRTDSLTELANRRARDELLDRENNLWLRHRRPYAIAVIDLDNFKHINDSVGHSAGDALLRRTAQILKGVIRGEDVAARVGGDEFTVLFRELKTYDPKQFLDRLSTAFANEEFGVSFGIAISKSKQTLLDTWKQADELMYEHKSLKKR